jgi:hypothetical protein
MIGVLAVIAILAALLVPKVFSAINDARINGTCISCDTVKTAVADHYGKYGKFDYINGTTPLSLPCTNYDTAVLIPEGLLDKPFVSKLAGGDSQASSHIELGAGTGAGTVSSAAAFQYSLDGSSSNSVASSPYVLQAHLTSVTAQDARDLNDRIDGPSLGAPDKTSADIKGRVEYPAPSSGIVSDVYIYLTHR